MKIDLITLADKYLENCQLTYGNRLTHSTRNFVIGFAKYLDRYQTLDQLSLTRHSQIALISEYNNHLTGGRYYAWMVAHALVEAGIDTVIYTNQLPTFSNFFKDFKKPHIEIVGKKAPDLAEIDIKADVYIGSPIYGAICSIRNGAKYNKPSYPMVYDPFPMIKKYQDKKFFTGWDLLLKEIRTSNTKVLTLSRSTHPYIHKWLNKTEDDLFYLYPSINSKIKNLIPKQKRGNFVLFISRLVPNKKLSHVLDACRDNKFNLKIIYPASGIKHIQMIEQAKMTDKVELIHNASEEDKFKLIKSARAVISGAVYEGFGMWMAEALACGTPVVCYDYPTFREIRNHALADNVYMAEHNNPISLSKKLKDCLEESKYTKGTNVFDFEAMVQTLKDKTW